MVRFIKSLIIKISSAVLTLRALSSRDVYHGFDPITHEGSYQLCKGQEKKHLNSGGSFLGVLMAGVQPVPIIGQGRAGLWQG